MSIVRLRKLTRSTQPVLTEPMAAPYPFVMWTFSTRMSRVHGSPAAEGLTCTAARHSGNSSYSSSSRNGRGSVCAQEQEPKSVWFEKELARHPPIFERKFQSEFQKFQRERIQS